jgi:hypothetical protein
MGECKCNDGARLSVNCSHLGFSYNLIFILGMSF